MAGEALGHINCEACGSKADIKKIKNSENLYLHCKKCGMDRRTGAALQQKWAAAILPENSGNIPGQEMEQSVDITTDGGEWVPSRETHKKHFPENSGSDAESEQAGTGKRLGIAAVFLLSMAGMFYKAIRG